MPVVTWSSLYHEIGRHVGFVYVVSQLAGFPEGLFQASDVVFGTAAGAVLGAAVPLAGTAALTTVGFTSSGIAAGSVAAGFQATVGNVAAGSLFATLQSVGATGGLAILGPVGIGAAVVGVTGATLWRLSRRKQPVIRIPVIYPHV